MKFLKGLFLFIAGVVITLLVVAAFLPKTYKVEREIKVEQKVEHVFGFLKMLKNQDQFSAWAKMDPDMKKEFRGDDGTVGFVSSWTSDKKEVGRGEQEILKIEAGKRIDYELRFFEPFEAKDHAFITTEPAGENATTVIWGFDGKMKYPMNIMLLVMDMEKMLGDQLTEGLDNLKNVLESNTFEDTETKVTNDDLAPEGC